MQQHFRKHVSKISLLFAAVALTSCANQIGQLRPQIQNDATVWLVDHGYHTSLIFERAGGASVEFAYGEKRWFAMNDASWWRIPRVLFWPSAGVLGRREWSGRKGDDWRTTYAELETISVPSSSRDVDTLVRELDAQMDAQSSNLVHNTELGFDFVDDQNSYWLFHNCNRVASTWVKRLGHPVRGVAILSHWKMAPAAKPRVTALSRQP